MTLEKRLAIAKDEFEVGPTCHISNGDEENVEDFAGNFHKTLPHNKFGEVRVCKINGTMLCMYVYVCLVDCAGPQAL